MASLDQVAARDHASAQPPRKQTAALVAVVVVGWVLAASAVGWRRWASWDEAIYLAKAAGPPDSLPWGPQRALGLPWLLSPLTVLEPPLGAIRLAVSAGLAVALVVALIPWRRRVGTGAVAAACIFLTWWPVTFGLSELYPNLIGAVLAVGALGWWTQWAARDRRAVPFVLAASFLVLLALVRPTESVVAAGAIVSALLWERGRPALRDASLCALVLALGLLPWLIEAFAEFGGPVDRLTAGRERTMGTDVGNPIGAFLQGTADQPLGSALTTGHAIAALAWWSALLLLAGVAAWRAAGSGQRRLVAVAATHGLVLLAVYLTTPATAPIRYLTPTVALLALPAGTAIADLLGARRSTARVIVAISAIVAVTWNVGLASQAASDARADRGILLAIGQAIGSDASGSPCAVASQFGWPSIALASGCDGDSIDPERLFEAVQDLEQLHREGSRVYVAITGSADPPAGWEPIATADRAAGWLVLTFSPD